MRYGIPEIGDIIKLTSPWTFALQPESRNETMYKFLPDRYEVPAWMLLVDWSKCGGLLGPSRDRGRAPVQIPGMPDGNVVESVEGRIKGGQPVWFRKLPAYLYRSGTRVVGKGQPEGAVYRLHYHKPDAVPFTLPEGTELLVDRVYIRQGAPEFSSVSFKWPDEKARFFVSMGDALCAEFDFVKHKDILS